MNPIHVLLSTDCHYIMPTSVTMKSVSVQNLGSDVVFHIIVDDGVQACHKHQLENIVRNEPRHRVEFHKVHREYFANFPQLGRGGAKSSYITQATYYRLIMTDILPEEVHKVIYMDGDVINTAPLSSLWESPITSYAVGAVTDMAEDWHDFSRLGYDRKYGYFNAGVLLINLDYWREHHLKEQFLKLIAEEPERIVLHDQDVLNIVLHDQKLNLPMCYNVQNGFLCKPEYSSFRDKYKEYEENLKQAISQPVLIHFTDNKKPWHVEDCNPYGYEFMKYYKQTQWRYHPLGHCNRSIIRYWGAKVLRFLHLLAPARTDEYIYYSLEELQNIKKQYSKTV
jgi:lipopolysaccharide biosynthesis glycosyltransferase